MIGDQKVFMTSSLLSGPFTCDILRADKDTLRRGHKEY